MNTIEVKNLTKKFGKYTAVDNINLTVQKGSIYGFLGPNGSGKSTTIRMLCGVLSKTSGSAKIFDYDVTKNTKMIKNKIGYMSQKFSLYDDLTINENLNFYGGIYGLDKNRLEEQKKYILEMAGLTERSDILTKNLSGGWKQRLALGCALLHNPELIFLDEPTAGVDPVSRRIFWQMIYKLVKEGVTVFVTTHYMDEAESFDEISFIFNGKIIANGTPKKLIEKENVTSLDDVFIKYVQNYTNEKYVSSFDALKNLVRKDN